MADALLGLARFRWFAFRHSPLSQHRDPAMARPLLNAAASEPESLLSRMGTTPQGLTAEEVRHIAFRIGLYRAPRSLDGSGGARALFPQLVFVPLMQGAINRRANARVWVLRQLGISTVERRTAAAQQPGTDAKRIDRALRLNMGIFKLKFSMNFLMNFCSHLQVVAALLIGGWMVHTDQLQVGGVVAFISAVGRLNDPWGDLVNYFRDLNVSQVRFGLVADRVNGLQASFAPAIPGAQDAGALA